MAEQPLTTPWSSATTAALRCAAARLVPADAGLGLPGADDPAVLADMLATAGTERGDVEAALRQLDRLAAAPFAAQQAREQDAALAQLEATDATMFLALAGLVMRCYYRDDRVMRSLGMAPRPPFPQGFEVPQGDWSLLDPVRNRAARIYR